MLYVYINYPNPHFTLHHDPLCKEIYKHNKPQRRIKRIDNKNINETITEFLEGKHKFKPNNMFNDMWLEISLEKSEEEIGFFNTIHMILCQKYGSFKKGTIKNHC